MLILGSEHGYRTCYIKEKCLSENFRVAATPLPPLLSFSVCHLYSKWHPNYFNQRTDAEAVEEDATKQQKVDDDQQQKQEDSLKKEEQEMEKDGTEAMDKDSKEKKNEKDNQADNVKKDENKHMNLGVFTPTSSSEVVGKVTEDDESKTTIDGEHKLQEDPTKQQSSEHKPEKKKSLEEEWKEALSKARDQFQSVVRKQLKGMGVDPDGEWGIYVLIWYSSEIVLKFDKSYILFQSVMMNIHFQLLSVGRMQCRQC